MMAEERNLFPIFKTVKENAQSDSTVAHAYNNSSQETEAGEVPQI